MHQIINFFIRHKNFIVFLLLFTLSLLFTVQANSYQRSKFINSANWLTGGVFKTFNNWSDYFSLKSQNELLIEENRRLREVTINKGFSTEPELTMDSTSVLNQYHVISASVIKNSIQHAKNYLTIDKGTKDGLVQDMGVITSNGVVGIVENTSKNFATVQTLLNELSLTNAQLKNSNHFGTLKWDTRELNQVQLVDIPRQANVKKGIPIVTGGMSTIFPKGIPIGKISSFELNANDNSFVIEVTLFNDMSNIGHVYIIKNRWREEQQQLQQDTN